MILQAADSPLTRFSECLKFSFVDSGLQRLISIELDANPLLGTPCWCWMGRLNRNGYGRAWWRGREPVAHRAVFESLIGDIPKKLLLDHLCRIRHCVNPWHMDVVTHRENTQRGAAVLFRCGANT
jgi:hypothetical protein